MLTSPKQVSESLSSHVSYTGRDSSGIRTLVHNDESRPRTPLSPRSPASKKSRVTVHNNSSNLPDIYTRGQAPARRNAMAVSGLAAYRTRHSKAISPPKATLIHKRYGSHEPTDLAAQGASTTSDDKRANPFNAVVRRRSLSTNSTKFFSTQAPDLKPNPAVGLNLGISADPSALLPALPIAGSPGTPTLISGAKELFQHFEDSSGESDAPGDEYRLAAPRKRVKKRNVARSEEEADIPVLFNTHRCHTPENLHPPPQPGRPQRYDSSSPPPVKRFFPRDSTPTS